MEQNINSSISSISSLIFFHIFFNLLTKYRILNIYEIYDKKFLNTITIGGFIIVIYVMFFEDPLIDFIKKMNLTYKQIFLYLFISYSILYIILLKDEDKFKKSLYVTPASYKDRKTIIKNPTI